MNYIESSLSGLPLVESLPPVRKDLDDLMNIVINFQEKFYHKIFGLEINFSNFLDLLKKIDIPSKNITVFYSHHLTSEIVFSAAKKNLGFNSNLSLLSMNRYNKKRPKEYLISIQKNGDEKNPGLVIEEALVTEMFLRFQKESTIFNKLLICRDTIFQSIKTGANLTPCLVKYHKEKYSCEFINLKNLEKNDNDFIIPSVSFYAL